MKDPRLITSEFRRVILPETVHEAITYARNMDVIHNPLGDNRFRIVIDYRLKWVRKLRDLYLGFVYKEYFMEDGLLEEKQKAMEIFDEEFGRMISILVAVLNWLGYKIEYDKSIEFSTPVSSAISVLGLMALDCKVSDPYILGSILER